MLWKWKEKKPNANKSVLQRFKMAAITCKILKFIQIQHISFHISGWSGTTKRVCYQRVIWGCLVYLPDRSETGGCNYEGCSNMDGCKKFLADTNNKIHWGKLWNIKSALTDCATSFTVSCLPLTSLLCRSCCLSACYFSVVLYLASPVPPQHKPQCFLYCIPIRTRRGRPRW